MEGGDAQNRYNILFLCTRNSTRGILAEALMNLRGGTRFQAFSAGTQPAGQISKPAQHLLQRLGIPTDGLRSKSWREFADPHSPKMDFIFTLCDTAIAEKCPDWPGQPVTAFWSIPDPSLAEGSDVEKAAAYRRAFGMLERRIALFLSLPLESIDRLSLGRHLDHIGQAAEHNPSTALLHPSEREI